jgi:hypothetical protein
MDVQELEGTYSFKTKMVGYEGVCRTVISYAVVNNRQVVAIRKFYFVPRNREVTNTEEVIRHFKWGTLVENSMVITNDTLQFIAVNAFLFFEHGENVVTEPRNESRTSS